MTDFSTTRLFIMGSKEEIERFIERCIRTVPREGFNHKTFDFDALVPMPWHIKCTMPQYFGLLPQHAINPVAFSDWYHWRVRHWGTKWLPSNFTSSWIASDVYECTFNTPWQCPHPIINALAIAHPELKGFAISYIHSDCRGEIGEFADGVYKIIEVESDYVYDDLVNCGCICECDCVDEAEPEIHRMISRPYLCWDDLENDVRAALSWVYEQNSVISSV